MTQPTLFTGDVALREGAMNKRLGVIALGTDQVIEPTFARIFTGLPIDMFVNRIAYENPLMLENLAAMERDLDRCLGNILPALDLDVVAFGCSSGTVAIGEQTLAERCRAIKPGVAVTNPVSAAVAAFTALDAQHISILTPYSTAINEEIAAYFIAAGLDVLSLVGFGIDDDREIAHIDPATIRRGAASALHPEADALFLSCTALRAADEIVALERQFTRPVVTSNQALAWHALRLAGIDTPLAGYGCLFAQSLQAEAESRRQGSGVAAPAASEASAFQSA